MAATRKKKERAKKKKTPKKSRIRWAAERPPPPQVMVFFYDDDTLRRFRGHAEKADFEHALRCTEGNMKEAGELVWIDDLPDEPVMLYGKVRTEAEQKYRKKHGLPVPPPPKPPKPRPKRR